MSPSRVHAALGSFQATPYAPPSAPYHLPESDGPPRQPKNVVVAPGPSSQPTSPPLPHGKSHKHVHVSHAALHGAGPGLSQPPGPRRPTVFGTRHLPNPSCKPGLPSRSSVPPGCLPPTLLQTRGEQFPWMPVPVRDVRPGHLTYSRARTLRGVTMTNKLRPERTLLYTLIAYCFLKLMASHHNEQS